MEARSLKECPDCGKVMLATSLARHQRSHAVVHICARCGAAFRHRDALERHALVKHSSDQQPPFACPLCEQRFTRGDHLDAHRARVHMNPAHEQLQAAVAAAREQQHLGTSPLDILHEQLTAVRAQLLGARASVVLLQEQSDALCAASARHRDLSTEADDDDGDTLQLYTPAMPPTRNRYLTHRCSCARFDAARLGEVQRCSTPACSTGFHWLCAGYARPLSFDAYILCAGCLALSPFAAAAYEDASSEVVLLDACLAVRGLRREPVAADGLCLFAAVSRATGLLVDDLFQDTMHTLSTYAFEAHDPASEASEAVRMRREAARFASKRLHTSAHCDSRLLYYALVVLAKRFDLICFEAQGRSLHEQPEDHPQAGGYICYYGRGINLDHYDAVVVAGPR